MNNDEEINKLILDLQNGNDRQRRIASYQLGKSKNPDAVPALIHAFDDTDSSVRQNVINGLKSIGSEGAIAFLESKGVGTVTAGVKVSKNTSKVVNFVFGFLFCFIIWNGIGIIAYGDISMAVILEVIWLALPFALRKFWFGFGVVSYVIINAIVVSVVVFGEFNLSVLYYPFGTFLLSQ